MTTPRSASLGALALAALAAPVAVPENAWTFGPSRSPSKKSKRRHAKNKAARQSRKKNRRKAR